MKPDTIRKATEALAQAAGSWSDARRVELRLGELLPSKSKRALATDQINKAAMAEVELSLLQMAASADDLLSEVADSALRELCYEPLHRPQT